MSISKKDLKPSDVGRWVVFTPLHGEPKKGRIKSWNDRWIFVVYKCAGNWDKFKDYTGCATDSSALKFVKESPK